MLFTPPVGVGIVQNIGLETKMTTKMLPRLLLLSSLPLASSLDNGLGLSGPAMG